MVPVDRDATHAGDNAAKIFVFCIEFRGKDQHGVVKRELGFRGRNLPQRFNTLREPVGRLLGVRHLSCQSDQDDCRKKAGQLHREGLDKSGGVRFERRTTSTLTSETPRSDLSCGKKHLLSSSLIAPPACARLLLLSRFSLPSSFSHPNSRQVLHCVFKIRWSGRDTHNIWGFMSGPAW